MKGKIWIVEVISEDEVLNSAGPYTLEEAQQVIERLTASTASFDGWPFDFQMIQLDDESGLLNVFKNQEEANEN